MINMDDGKNYQNNDILYKEIVESKRIGKLTHTAVNMLIRMSNKLSRFYSYSTESRRNCALQYGLNDVFKNWDKINMNLATNGTVVATYYTQVIKQGFARGFYRRSKVVDKRRIKIQNIVRILAN